MFYIYILYSESADRYYVGYTEDVNRRLHFHNNPIKSCYTSKYTPWILKTYFEVGDSKSKALRMERKIKKMKSRNYIEKLLNGEVGKGIFDLLLNKID